MTTPQVNNFPTLLEKYKTKISKALPRHLSVDKMASIAMMAFNRNPKLKECDPVTVLGAVIQAAQLGLEPDMLGRSYLVPYNNKRAKRVECQFIPGWKGLIDLVHRSKAGSATTGAVFEGDEFDFQLGTDPKVRHKPQGEDDPKKITHVYAIGKIQGWEFPIIEVWPISKVIKHRNKYNKVGNNHYSFTHFEMYARKVVLLQVLKYMPLSTELSHAMVLNDAAEIGEQGLTVDNVIEGTWQPVMEEKPDTDAVKQYRDNKARELEEMALAESGPDGLGIRELWDALGDEANNVWHRIHKDAQKIISSVLNTTTS